MISFIVSAYERPEHLRCCLASLKLQTVEHEIIVTCNAVEPFMVARIYAAAQMFEAKVIPTGQMGARCCYSAAEIAVGEAKGEWLCFPSDDSYYLPRFSEIMLRAAHQDDLDLVFCAGVLYSKNVQSFTPFVHQQEARVNCIDKTAFIVKRYRFQEFPGKDPTKPVSADGLFVEALRRRGVRCGAAPGVLVVHN